MIALLFIILVTCGYSPSTAINVSDNYDVISGNVTLAFVIEVNDPDSGNGVCGFYDVNSIQPLVAVTWFLDRLNAMNYIPGVTIGWLFCTGC
jgi:hypothetical protein